MNNVDIKISKFENYIKELEQENKIIGLSVAFVYNGETIYAKGFGKASTNSQEKITPDTIMSIQSISKSFASTAIMHLVEEKLIDLDTPLVEYLPYFKTSDKTISDKITVKQLLSHTAGFPSNIGIANLICPNRHESIEMIKMQNELGISDDVIESIKSFEDITKYFANVEIKYNPGEDWSYCTDAYAIVGDLFEKVSGRSWYEHIENNIFKPLDMKRTTLDPIKAKENENSARYHSLKSGDEKDSSELIIEETPFPTNPIAAPAGFIYSTANDLAKYLSAHMNHNNSLILKGESLDVMQTLIGIIKNEAAHASMGSNEIAYGLAWFIKTYKGLKVVEHSGGYTGVRCNVSMVPEKKLGVVVLSNFDKTNPVEICNKAIDILL